MKFICRLVCSLMFLLFVTPVQAHKFAPSLLRLNEVGEAEYNVVWKTPIESASTVPMAPVFPAGCDITGDQVGQAEGTGVTYRVLLKCAESLLGREVSVTGLAENRSAILFSIEMLDGVFHQELLNGEKSTYTVPASASLTRVMWQYSRLGAQHILGGIDHLLFVFGLLLLVGRGKRLVLTITAFTIGHSITLALVALGYFEYPVALVEFTIALSIFVLAVELSRPNAGGLLRQYPWWLAAGFGLLHGMGFAGALTEIGIPQHAVPIALLFFNIGIELGQLAFIFSIILLTFLFKQLVKREQSAPAAKSMELVHEASRYVPMYVLGALAAMWCVERGLEVF